MREKPGLDLSDHGTVPSSSGNLTQEGTTSAWVAVRVHTLFQPCHQTNASGEGRRAAPAYAIAEPGVETPGRELERTRLTHARMPLTPGSSGKMAPGSISSDRVRIRRMHRSTQTDAPAPPAGSADMQRSGNRLFRHRLVPHLCPASLLGKLEHTGDAGPGGGVGPSGSHEPRCSSARGYMCKRRADRRPE